jgi:hypothetical protein
MSDIITVTDTSVSTLTVPEYSADSIVFVPGLNEIWYLTYATPNAIVRVDAATGLVAGYVSHPTALWTPLKLQHYPTIDPSYVKVASASPSSLKVFDANTRLLEQSIGATYNYLLANTSYSDTTHGKYLWDSGGGAQIGSVNGTLNRIAIASNQLSNAASYGAQSVVGEYFPALGATYSYTFTLNVSNVAEAQGQITPIPTLAPAPLKIIAAQNNDVYYIRNGATGNELVRANNAKNAKIVGSAVYTVTSSTPAGLTSAQLNTQRNLTPTTTTTGSVIDTTSTKPVTFDVLHNFPYADNFSGMVMDDERNSLWIAFYTNTFGSPGILAEYSLTSNTIIASYPAYVSYWSLPTYPMVLDKARSLIWLASADTGKLYAHSTIDGSLKHEIFINNYNIVELTLAGNDVWAIDGGSGNVYRYIVPAEIIAEPIFVTCFVCT